MLILTIGIVLCAVVVGYCYLLYPFIIHRLAVRYPEPTLIDDSYSPSVSVILAVHNEERVIEQCLESLLALEYPKEKMEILVGSDGSSDHTDEMLRGFQQRYPFIRPFFFPTQRGKMPVLNDLVEHATGEILFFADADITLSSNTLRAQLRHYTDERIGAISGFYKIHSREHTSLFRSEERYASLEQQIRTDESVFHSTMGFFGGNYTIRRSSWRPLPDGLVHDDFYVVLSVLDQGLRVYFEPASVSSDLFMRNWTDEFRRKSRSASRGYHTLSFFPKLALPSAGRTSFLLWSHKILRWLTPFLMLAIVSLSMIGCIVYGDTGFWAVSIAAAVLVAMPLVGLTAERRGIHIPIVYPVSWFLIMNAAYLVGTWRYLNGSDEAIWKASTRPPSQSRPVIL